jgi:cytochrome P450
LKGNYQVSVAFHCREPAQPPRWQSDRRAWLITRYADATRLLKSDDISIIDVVKKLQKLSDRMNGAFSNTILLFGNSHPVQNLPTHNPIRAELKDLVGDILRRWTADKVGDLVVELLASAAEGDCLDAIQILAKPIPATIIADALGLQLPEFYRCGELTRELSTIWSREVHALRDLFALEKSAAALVQLLTTKFGGDRREEFAGMAFLTLAGVDTTTGLLGSAIYILSQDRTLQNRLREEPALVNGFVNETLRCCPPARRIYGHRTVRDITLSGVEIPRDAFLIFDVESAHHDPDAYPDPGQFDPTRSGPPNLAFSAGAHACVGVALARLEAKVLIDRLLQDYAMTPASEARLGNSRDWYEFESLPIRLEPL